MFCSFIHFLSPSLLSLLLHYFFPLLPLSFFLPLSLSLYLIFYSFLNSSFLVTIFISSIFFWVTKDSLFLFLLYHFFLSFTLLFFLLSSSLISNISILSLFCCNQTNYKNGQQTSNLLLLSFFFLSFSCFSEGKEKAREKKWERECEKEGMERRRNKLCKILPRRKCSFSSSFQVNNNHSLPLCFLVLKVHPL